MPSLYLEKSWDQVNSVRGSEVVWCCALGGCWSIDLEGKHQCFRFDVITVVYGTANVFIFYIPCKGKVKHKLPEHQCEKADMNYRDP